jgi:hypothetical protein
MPKTYYGKPCKYGHQNEHGQVLRYGSSRACVECTILAASTPGSINKKLEWQRENREPCTANHAIARRKRQLKAIADKQVNQQII